ncbi:MAG: hypothetical protein LGB78_08215 [Sulfurovum sp.]|nr:hypothetical protein [Sulfurovum sp.]MCB4781290.1 hypothetical protein [Sulfurovum sp.]
MKDFESAPSPLDRKRFTAAQGNTNNDYKAREAGERPICSVGSLFVNAS